MRITYRPAGLTDALGAGAAAPLAPKFTTRYPLVVDGDLERRELDEYRRQWSPAGLVVTWDPNPLGGPWGVRFDAAGRLALTNPATPPRVYPGDRLHSGLEVVDVTAFSETQLAHGVTFRHSDGTTSTHTLARATATAGAPTRVDTPLDVPAGVTGVDVWVDASGPGWGVRRAGVALESRTPKPGQLTIRRGRSSEAAALEPSTCSATLWLNGAPPVAAGDDVDVWVDLAALEAAGVADWQDLGVRYTGRVADVDAIVTPGGPNQLLIVAASLVDQLPSINVGAEPWPRESALARGARVLAYVDASGAAGAVQLPEGDAGPDVAARDVDRQDAAGLLTELANDAGLRLLESRAGVISLEPPLPRTTAPTVTLTPSHFARPLRMPQEWGPTVVRVEYGTSDDRQLLEVSAFDTSVVFGPGPVTAPTISTQLADEDGAYLRARRELALGATPVWRVRAVVVDVLRLLERGAPGDLDVVAGVLRLEVGDLVQLEDLPAEAPALAGQGLVVVLGANETIGPDTWRFELAVVDAPLLLLDDTWQDVAASADRWLDVDPSTTWAAQPAYL